MRWARPVGHVEEMHTKFYSEDLKGKDYLQNLGVDGMTLLERIVEKQDIRVWPNLSGSR
jgi:hypothetical protein